MKKILIFVLLYLLFIPKTSFAISYKDEINLVVFPANPNTQNNINSASLIENYLLGLKKEIALFTEKYDIKSDKELKNFLLTIEKMTISIKKIQTISIEKETSEEVMKSIINDLKILNPKLKLYLKNKKASIYYEAQKTKEKYINISNKLSVSLNKFIQDFSLALSKSSNTNKNRIYQNLELLKNENLKLMNFKHNYFNTSIEVKSRFLRILNNIKNNIIQIKSLV